jgi:23S rRNA pseudouridine1911/1915/1917 synthase
MSAESTAGETIELIVGENHVGSRLDWFLAQQLPQYSRVYLHRAINAVGVKVDGHRAKASHRLRAGDHVTMVLPELPRVGPVPEDIPLDVIFEDAEIAVINKPPAMVVHPGKGHWQGTLTSALAFHFENLSAAGGPSRPGIVHRLDRDTSGVMVVAKTDSSHMRLAEQFENRTTEKEYFAIVVGVPDRDRDLIDLPIGPHPNHREKMAVRRGHPDSRESQTFYEVIERFAGFAALKVLPKTGRTHQIRLHLAHIGYPVLCDRLYGGRARLTRGELSRDPSDEELVLDRQALHARRLKIVVPTSGQSMDFVAPLPADLTRTLDELRRLRPR